MSQTSIDQVALHHPQLQGYVFRNHAVKRSGSIILFGGSGGDCWAERAHWLAQQGYFVLALYYFGQPSQPKTLCKVPIDFIHDAIALVKKENPYHDTLTLMGISKGGELALLLGSLVEEIDHIVAYVPSSHVFQGIDGWHPGSSWTYQGKAVPYLSFRRVAPAILIQTALQKAFTKKPTFRLFYASARQRATNVEAARIKIEQFQGELLLFSGSEDTCWDASSMCQEILAHAVGKAEHVDFRGAGHIFAISTSASYLWGGNIESNKRAADQEQQQLLAHLHTWHPLV
ncbi:MAG: alpha/beta hydrolase [Erysipelotrichaceae bacterium]